MSSGPGTPVGPLESSRSSLDKPQRFGFWPTRSFWKNLSHWGLVGWPFAVLIALVVVVVSVASPSPLVGALLGGAVLAVTLGLFERYTRRRALGRGLMIQSRVPPDQSPK